MKKIKKLMGGEVLIEVMHDSKTLSNEIINYGFNFIKELISIFNFYDKNSSLSILNQKREIEYNYELAFLIKKSIEIYDYTNGHFNIFLGNENIKRKSDKRLPGKTRENPGVLKNTKNKKINPNKLISIIKNKIKLNDDSVKIDLGGIAKGYIVDRTIEEIKSKFKWKKFGIYIDARGDIAFNLREKIKAGIENPFDNNYLVEFLKIKKGALITSGHNKQYFKSGSHIVGDENEILSITLVSEKMKCYELDFLGTYLAQLKSEKVLHLLEFDNYLKDVEGFLILKNKKILKSSFLDMYI